MFMSAYFSKINLVTIILVICKWNNIVHFRFQHGKGSTKNKISTAELDILYELQPYINSRHNLTVTYEYSRCPSPSGFGNFLTINRLWHNSCMTDWPYVHYYKWQHKNIALVTKFSVPHYSLILWTETWHLIHKLVIKCKTEIMWKKSE
jgi:hypothetical protein